MKQVYNKVCKQLYRIVSNVLLAVLIAVLFGVALSPWVLVIYALNTELGTKAVLVTAVLLAIGYMAYRGKIITEEEDN